MPGLDKFKIYNPLKIDRNGENEKMQCVRTGDVRVCVKMPELWCCA